MKTKWIIEKLTVFALLLLLAGAWLLLGPKNKTVYGITDGTYRMVTAENGGSPPLYILLWKGKRCGSCLAPILVCPMPILERLNWMERSGYMRTMEEKPGYLR